MNVEDKVKYKVLIFGDSHLSSKNYGSHVDYANEALYWFKNVTQVAKENEYTHIIGTGDMSYGRFHSLEYRLEVEEELIEQNRICQGNRYEVKGNHDSATYGMTEYEYYVGRKLIKPSTKLDLGGLVIYMADSGEYKSLDIKPEPDKKVLLIMHDYMKFRNTFMADYGQAIILEELEEVIGVNYIIGGHIHNHEIFDGVIGEKSVIVHYLGCPSRPSYHAERNQMEGNYAEIIVYESGAVKYNVIEFPLWDLADSFNLDKMEDDARYQEAKRVDVNDIVKKIGDYTRIIGNPEDAVMAMVDIPLVYRQKAVELLMMFGEKQ